MQPPRFVEQWREDMKARSSRSGQAATEYLVVAGMIAASVMILGLLLYTFKEYGGRVLNLVASEYP